MASRISSGETGQAVGNAACAALDTSTGIDRVSVAEVQKRQQEQNVMIHFDDALIPKDLEHSGDFTNDFDHV